MNVPETESALYPAVKALFEAQGYEVKSEIGAADVVAVRAREEPVVVELKLGFSLTLFQQAVQRLSTCDTVYIAVAHKPGKRFSKSLKANITLARRLGLGLITVRLRDQHITVHCDPGPYAPRKSKRKQTALLREFARRRGDPNSGGQTRQGLTTAYRQDAIILADYILKNGPQKGSCIASATGIDRATRMMADNHYGWFCRISRGTYALTALGEKQAAEGVKPKGG